MFHRKIENKLHEYYKIHGIEDKVKELDLNLKDED